MTNLALLREKLNQSGLGPVTMAAAWDISMPTYYKLLSGESEFTASQIQTTTELFGLTRDERDAIFFA